MGIGFQLFDFSSYGHNVITGVNRFSNVNSCFHFIPFLIYEEIFSKSIHLLPSSYKLISFHLYPHFLPLFYSFNNGFLYFILFTTVDILFWYFSHAGERVGYLLVI